MTHAMILDCCICLSTFLCAIIYCFIGVTNQYVLEYRCHRSIVGSVHFASVCPTKSICPPQGHLHYMALAIIADEVLISVDRLCKFVCYRKTVTCRYKKFNDTAIFSLNFGRNPFH